MTELKILARYPFIDESKEYVKNNDITVKDLLDDPLYERARVIGIERIDNAFENSDVGNRSQTNETDYVMELLSYPIARMISVCIDDLFFKRRYALGEAVHVYKNLLKEKTSFLLDISKEFDLKVNFDEEEDKIFIHFTDYLHYAPTRYKTWKMINREVKNGYVHIDKKGLSRIIQESLRNRINNELDERNCNKEIYNTFSEDIHRIKNKVMMHRKKIEAMPVGKLDIKKLPPCLKEILSSIQAGENVPHMGRFALVSFLNTLKLNTNQILKIFSSAPDYEEEKTRYQVEHITGDNSPTSYKAPACDKMRTYGLCPTDKIDEVCKKTRHPVSYYRLKWKKEKKKK